MSPKDYRTLFIFLGVMIMLLGVFVVWQTAVHPTVPASQEEALREAMAAPKTDIPSQLTYAKDHEQEWLDANCGDRAKALPAWNKILIRFRVNVVGSGAEAANEGLKRSEAWLGKITGDRELDGRLIQAAVMSNLYGEGKVWTALSKELSDAASNDVIAQTLADNKY